MFVDNAGRIINGQGRVPAALRTCGTLLVIICIRNRYESSRNKLAKSPIIIDWYPDSAPAGRGPLA
jgi:hypothetical protein